MITEDKYKHIARVENFLSMMLTKAGISDHVFIRKLPSTLDSSWTDMILVDVLPFEDKDSHATGSANIFLYVKDEGSLRTIFSRLEEMDAEFDAIINANYNKHYVVQLSKNYQDYDSDLQYYCNVKNIEITVRKLKSNS